MPLSGISGTVVSHSGRETLKGEEICADPSAEFCCPYTLTSDRGVVSVACPLGTLCCGGKGTAQGGCCFGFNATSYTCDPTYNTCPENRRIG
jgi:hypothetical protein